MKRHTLTLVPFASTPDLFFPSCIKPPTHFVSVCTPLNSKQNKDKSGRKPSKQLYPLLYHYDRTFYGFSIQITQLTIPLQALIRTLPLVKSSNVLTFIEFHWQKKINFCIHLTMDTRDCLTNSTVWIQWTLQKKKIILILSDYSRAIIR